MPYGGFNWVEPTLNGLDDLDAASPIGRVYEVDVMYPRHLHNVHNDLPFLPQNSVPRGSKVRKLMATFEKKKNYVIHYRNLQQAIKNGLIVEKVNICILYDFKQIFLTFFLIFIGTQSYPVQSVGLVSKIY